MPIQFDSSSEDRGGGYLHAIGTWHMMVTDSTEQATKKNGELLDGWGLSAQVLDGTVRDKNGCTEVNKSWNTTIRNPSVNHSDGGEFCRKLQTYVLIALGKMLPADRGKSIAVDFRSEATVGRQFFVTTKLAQNKNDPSKSYCEIDGVNIYHVDDPAAAGFPRNQKLIDMIPPEHRLPKEAFDCLGGATATPATPGQNGSGNGHGNGNGSSHKQPTKAPSAVDLDDI